MTNVFRVGGLAVGVAVTVLVGLLLMAVQQNSPDGLGNFMLPQVPAPLVVTKPEPPAVTGSPSPVIHQPVAPAQAASPTPTRQPSHRTGGGTGPQGKPLPRRGGTPPPPVDVSPPVKTIADTVDDVLIVVTNTILVP